jgi:hypothetical protein
MRAAHICVCALGDTYDFKRTARLRITWMKLQIGYGNIAMQRIAARRVHVDEISLEYIRDEFSAFQINAMLITAIFQKSNINYIGDLALISVFHRTI